MAVAERKNLREVLERFIVTGLEKTGISLGRGAYGEVLEMKMNGERVAVKKIHEMFVGAEGWEANLLKFEEECVRLSEINHANIVAFRGISFEGNSNIPMLVMEYVPKSLRHYVEGNIPPDDKKRSILLDIAQGLSYLHGLDPPLIHRDLTSNNVLLTDDLHAKIADLGVSKLLNRASFQKMTNVPGTESHMPPEARVVDQQAYMQPTNKAKKLDVFSFGNVMINVLTGEFPVTTQDRDEKGKRRTEVERRCELLVKIQESKEKDLIIRCLNNNPDHRPATDELVRFFEGSTVEEILPLKEEEQEISFVDEPTYDVKCPVCFEIFEEAHQTSCCGTHICSQCVKKMTTCPQCRNSKLTSILDKFFSRQVQGLRVECYNSRLGCSWTGELRALKKHFDDECEKNAVKCKHCLRQCHFKVYSEHVQACPETPQPCPNECTAKSTKRKDLKKHLERECPLRVVGSSPVPHTANRVIRVAPLAMTMTNYSEYVKSGRTWYSAPFYTHRNGYKVQLRVDADWYKKGFVSVLVCVLKGEKDQTLTWPLHAKVEVALYNWRTNKPFFKKVLHLTGDGFCSRNMTDLPASWGKGEVEFISHSALAYDVAKNTAYVQQLHDCLSFQIKKVTFLKSPVIPKLPLWAGDNCLVVPYFPFLKQNNFLFYGTPFYTHQRGYKLCPRVDPNGFGDGKGNHLSVSCNLMKGEYDNELSWPISADVVIKMLNWKQNKNHRSYTVSFNKGSDSKSNSRVPIDGVAEMCWGSPKFAAHSSLPYNQIANTQYLNENCLLFKIEFFAYMDKVLVAKVPNPAVAPLYPCFTLSEFTKRKALGNVYYGDPFFSHRNGYKMQLRVDAAVGTNVGLYVNLMKGPHDDQLQWPFNGEIVLELVNWRGDEHHHRKVVTLSFHSTDGVRDRVIHGDRSTSSGYKEFIPHSSLPFNAETGTEYLREDCLHFRVKEVVVHSVPSLYNIPTWQSYRSIQPSFQFTINNFGKRKSSKRESFGPAFYTHQGGYKMRLNIEPCKGNYIAIYACLLQGENDATLSWPFLANVVVELLNWREDKNHHSYNIQFHERIPGKNNSRVEMSGDSKSWGTGSFISHYSLSYNNSTNTEYLKDDCLCIRVKNVATYSTRLVRKAPRWQAQNAAPSFTITNVTSRKQIGNFYFSPPFYVAKYKMCLKIYVGGSGAGKNTYVSMYACLLKGEDDHILEWPFCGDITVEVLNWRGDHGHYKNALCLDTPHDDSHSRCTTDVTVPSGYGKNKFMPISTLLSKYLEDDCMRVHVTNMVMYNTPLRSKFPRWQNWWNKSSKQLLAFTVTGVSCRLVNKSSYYSPPFYTHSNGYKLRLEVDIAYSEGQMGLYARLLAGEYDSSLKWPMNVDVSVEMVNWVSNNSHIIEIIKFGESSLDACKRVPKEEESAPTARGYSKFCSHAKLFGGPHHIQYVEEDCIHIRVKGCTIHSRKGLF